MLRRRRPPLIMMIVVVVVVVVVVVAMMIGAVAVVAVVVVVVVVVRLPSPKPSIGHQMGVTFRVWASFPIFDRIPAQRRILLRSASKEFYNNNNECNIYIIRVVPYIYLYIYIYI